VAGVPEDAGHILSGGEAGVSGFVDLPAEAGRVALNAYAPYSSFRVGAALSTEAGGVHVGCNVENSAFPVGGCAERHAIAAAVAAEGHAMRISAIAVVAFDPAGEPVACAPCGACRQAIIEFGPAAQVIFQAAAGESLVTAPAEALLPGAFSFNPVA
jgi:cytidine deaminase